MDLQLKGKTALVTGASMGIGRAIARGLAAEGVSVGAVARRADLLEQLAGEIEAAGGPTPVIMPADVMAEEAPAVIRDTALDALGHVDILVNCAGGSRKLPVDAPE